ncbi:MAG: hypothetical protein WD688_26450 [Candidatus Binatia bacterium]
MPVKLTPLMKKRLSRRAQEMIARSLGYFPELNGQTITVGYTRKHLGSASIAYRRGVITRLIIRLKVRKLTYQTIGHELTHLVQGLARGDRSSPGPVQRQRIPSGEKQCDIWTLARHTLFCDDAPTYIRMPRVLREHWFDYAESVRELCIAAIEKRSTHRLYIRWLETEVGKLTKAPPRQQLGPAQLTLPFADLLN